MGEVLRIFQLCSHDSDIDDNLLKFFGRLLETEAIKPSPSATVHQGSLKRQKLRIATPIGPGLAKMPVDQLVIAYRRAPNLGNLLSYRKIDDRGLKESTFTRGLDLTKIFGLQKVSEVADDVDVGLGGPGGLDYGHPLSFDRTAGRLSHVETKLSPAPQNNFLPLSAPPNHGVSDHGLPLPITTNWNEEHSAVCPGLKEGQTNYPLAIKLDNSNGMRKHSRREQEYFSGEWNRSENK
ncbi:hypothetical protein THAOC_02843 [Thalassiosira oceanica]|uniref:Uncharacterized protein n=1 Tax=Thalassiosira oceanica TaxID=159749 RepID=K0TQ50_THAOC|nr:hypothetical protein THAOC_02843 [Thalassiosira oceanica]|eukprot:EJK75432.1 hypothetical protein THAOC_02843 [Thalassiosira oceanica]